MDLQCYASPLYETPCWAIPWIVTLWLACRLIVCMFKFWWWYVLTWSIIFLFGLLTSSCMNPWSLLASRSESWLGGLSILTFGGLSGRTLVASFWTGIVVECSVMIGCRLNKVSEMLRCLNMVKEWELEGESEKSYEEKSCWSLIVKLLKLLRWCFTYPSPVLLQIVGARILLILVASCWDQDGWWLRW